MARRGAGIRNRADFPRGQGHAQVGGNKFNNVRRLARRALRNTTQVWLKAGLGVFYFYLTPSRSSEDAP